MSKDGVRKRVNSVNDEVIVYTGVEPMVENVLVCFELKKHLVRAHVSQAIAELIGYGRASKFPVLQVEEIFFHLILFSNGISKQILTDLDLSLAFYIADVDSEGMTIHFR